MWLFDDNSLQSTLIFLCRVVTLNMSPIDDTFISGSLDKTIRLWDLRSPNCQVLSRYEMKILVNSLITGI